MTAIPLSAATLDSLDASVSVPSYDRSQVSVGIVHFGVGGFHRAHQAMYHDRLMNEATISEPMTWTQICEQFPDEWVALVEIEWVNDRDFDFRSARVAGHGKRRREPPRTLAFWASMRCAVRSCSKGITSATASR